MTLKHLLAAIAAVALLIVPQAATAQLSNANVVAACGTPNTTYPAGATRAITQDTTGTICTVGGGGGGGAVTATAAAASVPVSAGTGKPLTMDLFSNLGVIIRAADGSNVDWTAPIPVTIANGVDVAEGLTTDSAYTGSGAATTISALKAIANSALSATPAAVNQTQLNSTAVLTGNGATGSGSQRITIASDNTPVAFKVDQTTPGTTNGVQSIAGTTGGALSYHVIAAASDNHVVIKNGAGTVYAITGTSIHTTYQYVRLYDAGTGFNGCNSATNIKAGYLIPGSATGAGGHFTIPVGLAFATGVSICITGAFTDTDTTAATASVLSVNVAYD